MAPEHASVRGANPDDFSGEGKNAPLTRKI
jgi:hypothetical protein